VTLSFPNLSRSYDPDRRRVRYWAHDSSMEIPCFVTEGALLRLNPNTARTEVAMLSTFDTNRGRINAVTNKLHAIGRQSFHVLEASDFV
jgi:hypothetical protein